MSWSRTFGGNLLERTRDLFPQAVRLEGMTLVAANAVAVLKGSATLSHAVVLENPAVRVEIELRGGSIRASCPCDVRRRGAACRHLWATLVKADSKGYLSQFRLPGLHWDFDRSSGEGAQSGWKTMVRTLGSAGRTGTPRPTPPGDDRRIVYSLDPHEAPRGDDVILHVSAQRRRKTGAWGRPRPRALSRDDVAATPDPVERRALELLQGGRHPSSTVLLSGPELRLNAAQITLALPDLCRSGRFHLWNSGDPGGLPAPCLWDDGEPWQVRIRLARDGKDFTLQVLMERPGETMDFREPLLFLEPGIVLTAVRASRFRFDGDFAWIRYLRQERPVRIRRAELRNFLKELYQLPGRVPVELPGEANVTELRPEPRPCLELAPLKESATATKG